MVNQLAAALGMGIYVMLVLYATKLPYNMMVSRGMEPIRAVYYNRKIVHMLAGGVGSLSVPFLFTDIWYPMVAGMLLTALLWSSHRAGVVMHWFQTEQNQNDVKFGLMWWTSISFMSDLNRNSSYPSPSITCAICRADKPRSFKAQM